MALPSDVHEAPITPLISALTHVTSTIGHDPDGVQIRIDANTTFEGSKISGEPDIFLQISGKSFCKELFTRRRLLCIECAFTQKNEDVMEKLEAFIQDIPELMVVGKININEKRYSGPGDLHRFGKLSGKKVQPPGKWFPDRNAGNDFGPVVKNGRTWIEIESIEVHMWVRPSRGPIDLEDKSPGRYAFGVMCGTIWQATPLTFVS